MLATALQECANSTLLDDRHNVTKEVLLSRTFDQLYRFLTELHLLLEAG